MNEAVIDKSNSSFSAWPDKLIIFTTTFVLFIVFILPGILVLPIKVVPFNAQPGYNTDHKREINGSLIVEQEFTSQESRLTGIGMTVGNPNLKNKKEVIMNLYESPPSTGQSGEASKNLVRTVKLSGLNIPDGEFVRFTFAPIVDSKGKTYKFTLESPDAPHEETLYVYFTKETPSWVGDMTYQEKKFEEGKLSFVTYHKPESKLSLMLGMYKSWFLRILGQ